MLFKSAVFLVLPRKAAELSGGVSDASVPLIGLVAAGVGLASDAIEEGIGALGRMLGIGGEETTPLVTATATSITPELAEAGEVVQKATAAVGDQTVTVSSEGVARQAADEFLGPGKQPLIQNYGSRAGQQIGWKSADGLRIVRIDTGAASPHYNFQNLATGGNLHVHF